jgi:hypothetical protein
MPNRQLTQQDNFETISTWLDVNLADPFPANLEHLPPNDNSRGIYFWFMKADGYKRLSNLGLNIIAITPTYKKDINGEQYDLVYLGTAGTGKKEKSNIINRLNWHLKNTHDEKHICSGFLSTLRQTVGAALSEDLIDTDTGSLINTFFSNLFYLYTLPYSGNSNTKSIIDEDEHCLISTIMPLFNIKNNPHARLSAATNPTRQLKVRRGIVMRNTRERLGCKKGNNGKTKSKKDDNKPPTSPENNYEIISEYNGCIEFTVTKDQSVHEVISGIEGLPTGKCEILIYNSANPKEFLYPSKRNNGKRLTGNKKENVYGYFQNPDTNKNNQPRWKLIQQEMLDKGIEEVTVRVCSDNVDEEKVVENSTEKKRGRGRPKKNEVRKVQTTKVAKTLEEFKEEIKQLNLGKNFKLVYTCAKGKNPIQLNYNGINNIDFRWNTDQNAVHQYNPDDSIENENRTWRDYIKNEAQQNEQILPAYSLYRPLNPYADIYNRLQNCFSDRFYIASAGWGIINSKFRLPKYDITFTKSEVMEDANTYRNPKKADYQKDINKLENVTGDILFLGGSDYLIQFISLTEHLKNVKILFINSELDNKLLDKINQNETFKIHDLNMTDRSNWHKKVAQWLCEIYCPQNNEANI